MKITFVWIASLICIPLSHGEDPSPATPVVIPVSAMIPGQPGLIKEGLLTRNEKGQGVFSYDGGQGIILSGSDTLLNKVQEKIPLYITIRSNHGTRRLGNFTALSVGRWLAMMGDDYRYSDDDLKVNLYEHAIALREKINENLTELPENQDWKGVSERYNDLANLIGRAYMAEPEPIDKTELAILASNLEREEKTFLVTKLTDGKTQQSASDYFVEKGYYGMDDNYRPEIYPMIAKKSTGSVAIAREGRPLPIGSGALIGPDLILTCRHNIDDNYAKSFDDTEYRVWVNYEERFFGAPVVRHVFRAIEIYRGKNHDFSLLKIERKPQEVDPEIRPLSLTTTGVRRWTPIFVVGHPKGRSRVVHDSSWVIFPHEIRNRKERGEITAQVTKEYLALMADPHKNSARWRAATQAESFMKEAYGKEVAAPETVYTFKKDGVECIGIESDTFKGDSGAPVMSREKGAILGILSQGVSDGDASMDSPNRYPSTRLVASAELHERAVPIRVIVAELDQWKPDWRQEWGVTIEN